MKKNFKISGISSAFVFCILFFVLSVPARAQPAPGRVGVNTDNPQAALHVAGDLRVDSLKRLSSAKRVVVIDSATGAFATVPMDSVKSASGASSVSGATVFYAENDAQISTNSGALQTRLSLVLNPGTYMISASCELSNSSYFAGTGARLSDGATTLADSNPYANPVAPWATIKVVALVSQTTYYLQWYVLSGTGTIGRARISATKVQ